MQKPRRRRGFERAGTVPATRLGLPARRVRDLSLLQGWQSVAGETLSRHAPARGVVRGVLEIEASDRRWHDAIEPLLPELAARLAVEQPALGVKKFRLHLVGEHAVPEARVVPGFVAAAPPVRAPRPRRGAPGAAMPEAPEAPTPTPPTREDLERRLERAAGRYLQRGDRQKA